MRHIYTARDAMDAKFLCGLLEQEGLKAVVQGEALQETWGNLNLTAASLPTVWVDDGDVARSLEIVEEYKRVDRANADRPDEEDATEEVATTSADAWVCTNCGRRNEQQFDRCWHCTHPRNAAPAIA